MTGRPGPVLVTGATGFLGAHVVRVFADAGWSVVAARRRAADPWRLAGVHDIAFVDFDLDDKAMLARAVSETNPQAVVHCAAYGVDYSERDLARAIAVNIAGTSQLIAAAARSGVKRFIHVGTSYEYGAAASPVSEDAPLLPQGVYGATKAAASVLAGYLGRSEGLALVILRPFTMYGPLERSTKLVPALVRACRSGERMALTPGEQIRDYIYVGDVAAAILGLAGGAAFPAGETINIGAGKPMTLRQLAGTIRTTLGGKDVFAWGERPYRDGEIMETWANTTKSERLLGTVAKTSLVDGIRAVDASLTAGGETRP